VLAEYVEHYNSHRPHRGIQLQVLVPGDGHPTYKVRRHDVLGGLICEYARWRRKQALFAGRRNSACNGTEVGSIGKPILLRTDEHPSAVWNIVRQYPRANIVIREQSHPHSRKVLRVATDRFDRDFGPLQAAPGGRPTRGAATTPPVGRAGQLPNRGCSSGAGGTRPFKFHLRLRLLGWNPLNGVGGPIDPLSTPALLRGQVTLKAA
jgi:hypothetical protein